MSRTLAIAGAVAGLLAAGAAAVGVVQVARGEHAGPARCPEGLVPLGARCCGEGQALAESGRCTGAPTRCGPSMLRSDRACTPRYRRISYPAGKLVLSPADWEAEGLVRPREASVDAFHLDATEVTLERWAQCTEGSMCAPLAGEPGMPVHGVSPEEADQYCRFAGGRLPTSDEWLYAAAGAKGRRFPWGSTGLTCRRAVYGLTAGPCGEGAKGPDAAGTRVDGATPEGALDMAGNVAEWTNEGAGRYVARGGSYQSRVAAELKSWAFENASPNAEHVGFRCAYE